MFVQEFNDLNYFDLTTGLWTPAPATGGLLAPANRLGATGGSLSFVAGQLRAFGNKRSSWKLAS